MYLQKNHLSQHERDEIFTNLTDKQKVFLTAQLKRGRKTLFANVLAKDKAGSFSDDVASKWEFLDYLDAGPGWQTNAKLFCECGRTLRYQYIVKNSQTDEVMKFGITHFAEHTGISPELAKEIVRGVERIDYEMDEILMKILNGWTLKLEGIDYIPMEIVLPNDIKTHFEYDVPLLDRQVARLRGQIKSWIEIQEHQRLQAMMKESERIEKQRIKELSETRRQIQANFKVDKHVELQEEFQLAIMVYLQELTTARFSASEVCTDLVINHGAPKDRYSSGRYAIFPDVCRYLEALTEKGMLKFIEKKWNMDRMYERVEKVRNFSRADESSTNNW